MKIDRIKLVDGISNGKFFPLQQFNQLLITLNFIRTLGDSDFLFPHYFNNKN